ncbi:MAG: AarF/ABC1/UbiB kinase family protein [Desulfuromonadales bacterium]|jgi:ubiquinone biosynthesis protein|nr:AarF/ABC1/UbiB kinase family protein [Desulfuromonadales bacterium]
MLPILRVNRNIRTIRRYRTILGVLIKYGFGHFIEQLNIDYYLELGKRIISLGKADKAIERLTQPQRLRMAMEELGPTFIKLGQLLSTRADILPAPYINEFRKLQDKVPAVPTIEIRKHLQDELGAPVDELFAEFRSTPIATASIAQVHLGRLHSGEQVAFKVRRPGIVQTIETDIDILTGLAYLIEQHIEGAKIYNPSGLVNEFRRTITRELNFNLEGRTVERFAANFAEDATVYIPKVFWKFSRETILTMEYIPGIKISELEELRRRGYDLKEIASRGADNFLKQILEHGLFHGDPHPGNLFILPDHVICMLDYGMVGRLGYDLKEQLINLLQALLARDVDSIISQLLYSGELTDDSDLKSLRRDLDEFIDDYYEILLQDIKAGKLLADFIEILVHHHIHLSPDLMLLAKALVTMEGVGRQLDPEFNMIAHLRPFMERIVRERLSPGHMSRDFLKVANAYGALARNLPRDIKEFLNRLNRNQFKIDLEHRGLDRLATDMDRSSNRVSFALIIGSLIVGSSLIIQTDKGPMLLGLPLLGLLGYLIAGLLGLWLAVGILRSGRL